jgi:putative acetyltransferase
MTRDIGASFAIEPGDPADAQVARLLRSSEAYSHSLYPPESVHTLPVEQLSRPSVRFLVARAKRGREPVGCGALLLQPDSCGEIKRMFVDPAARRRGVGGGVLRALEEVARAEGIVTLRLETGPGQREAVALYRSFGYDERGPFGGYRDDPFSIFMEKCLDD